MQRDDDEEDRHIVLVLNCDLLRDKFPEIFGHCSPESMARAALKIARDKWVAAELRGAEFLERNNVPREQWDEVLDAIHTGPKVVH